MVANLHYAQNMGHVGSLPAELKVHVMHAVCAGCCLLYFYGIDRPLFLWRLFIVHYA